MEIRGEHECKECDHQWSYYEMGSVPYPQCGSFWSVGVGGRERHTAIQTDLDLSAHRSAVGDGPTRDAAPALKFDLRDYIRQMGYVRGGGLLPLGDTPLTTHELLHAVDVVARSNRPMDDEQPYVISLLQCTDEGECLVPGPVSDSMTDARGLAYVEAADAYCRDFSTWLSDNLNPEIRTTSEILLNHHERAETLDGAVSLSKPEAPVEATREIRTALIDNDLGAPASAHDTLAVLL